MAIKKPGAMAVPAAGLKAAVAKDEHQDIPDVTDDHTLLNGVFAPTSN
jgi:hypothetical protein